MRLDFVRYSAAVSFLLMVFASPSHAQQDKAKNAYLAGNYTAAYQDWLERAQNGEPEAQFNLGFLFENGQGVNQDFFTAARWYDLAARQNYPAADQMLRAVHGRIEKATQDKLATWLPNAERGDPISQLALSEILAAGQIVEKNNIGAMKWLRLALENTENKSLRNRMLRFEKNLTEQMTEAELKEVQTKIDAWKSLKK